MKVLRYPTPVYVLAGSVRREDLTRMAERRRIARQLAEGDAEPAGLARTTRRVAGRLLIAVGVWMRGAAPIETAPRKKAAS